MMAIVQSICTSFKSELVGGIHDLDTDSLFMALFTSTATLGATTTEYAATDEVVGTGYTAGGKEITGAVIATSGTTAFVDFDNVVWPNASITARGALIYNASKANRAVVVLDFTTDKTSTDSDFSVVMPTPDATDAILRVA